VILEDFELTMNSVYRMHYRKTSGLHCLLKESPVYSNWCRHEALRRFNKHQNKHHDFRDGSCGHHQKSHRDCELNRYLWGLPTYPTFSLSKNLEHWKGKKIILKCLTKTKIKPNHAIAQSPKSPPPLKIQGLQRDRCSTIKGE